MAFHGADDLTSQQNLFHASPLRRAVPFAMAKLVLALTKAQADAFGDLLQQRRLVATVLPADVEDFVGNLLCLPARLHWIQQNVAPLSPARKREERKTFELLTLSIGGLRHAGSGAVLSSRTKLISRLRVYFWPLHPLITFDTLVYITQR